MPGSELFPDSVGRQGQGRDRKRVPRSAEPGVLDLPPYRPGTKPAPEPLFRQAEGLFPPASYE